jgi:eukaryotic translation initiation factor 2C
MPERLRWGTDLSSMAISWHGEYNNTFTDTMTFSNIHRSMMDMKGEANIIVDLDEEQGRPKSDGSNSFRLVVRRTKTVNLAVIEAYIKGKTSFSTDVLEGLTFLDHVLRENPSKKFIPIKRSFFSEDNPKYDLGGGVEAYKGMYQSIRVAHVSYPWLHGQSVICQSHFTNEIFQPGRLVVNIDVSNACFWARISLMGAALEIFKYRDPQHLAWETKPKPDGLGGRVESEGFKKLRRLRKLIVRANYRGCPVAGKDFTVKGFVNANAREYTIDLKDAATGATKTISILDYFKSRYNVILNYPDLPLVEMTKKGVVYPLEILTLTPNQIQRFPFKLDDLQTANMIKFAVSKPNVRMNSIEKSKAAFNHSGDPVLNAFGLKIEEKMLRSKARLLPNPEIMFGGGQKLNPGTAGRWDLRGKRFYAGNTKPLTAWGVGYFKKGRSPLNRKQIEAFVDHFAKSYTAHGGQVATRSPIILDLPDDPAQALKFLHDFIQAKYKANPELYLIIVQDKNSFHWTRLKKSADCRFGVASQVVQSAQVAKCSPQYISNVLMKVNAKLGGVTSRISSKINGDNIRPFSMIIGADVSHPTPGSSQPSMAAMTASLDSFGGRYMGACQTNGGNVEVISETNIREMLGPLITEWATTVGRGQYPKNIYYFRDGVSSGQFQHVLQQEIPIIKEILLQRSNGTWDGKFTVVIASKRHHIRAFPNPSDKGVADKNGNPLPGVLIERDVTNPHEWDFFLYSHVALQGTARPVHYNVILDQIGHTPNQLQNMIYDHCYQYVRSTTSVSLCKYLFPLISPWPMLTRS